MTMSREMVDSAVAFSAGVVDPGRLGKKVNNARIERRNSERTGKNGTDEWIEGDANSLASRIHFTKRALFEKCFMRAKR